MFIFHHISYILFYLFLFLFFSAILLLKLKLKLSLNFGELSSSSSLMGVPGTGTGTYLPMDIWRGFWMVGPWDSGARLEIKLCLVSGSIQSIPATTKIRYLKILIK